MVVKKTLGIPSFLLVVTGAMLITANISAQGEPHSMPKASEKVVPLTCTPEAMTPAERKEYDALKARLRASVKELKELPGGYAFRYEPDKSLFLDIARFITVESICCSFYHFTLEKQEENGPVWLRITGPKETKIFIKDALL